MSSMGKVSSCCGNGEHFHTTASTGLQQGKVDHRGDDGDTNTTRNQVDQSSRLRYTLTRIRTVQTYSAIVPNIDVDMPAHHHHPRVQSLHHREQTEQSWDVKMGRHVVVAATRRQCAWMGAERTVVSR